MYQKINTLVNAYLNLVKTILALKTKKLVSLIVLILWTFLNINKFSDLNLRKFRLFNLVKILIILFLLFLIFLYSLPSILSTVIIFIDISKYFTTLIQVVLKIEISNLVILLKS